MRIFIFEVSVFKIINRTLLMILLAALCSCELQTDYGGSYPTKVQVKVLLEQTFTENLRISWEASLLEMGCEPGFVCVRNSESINDVYVTNNPPAAGSTHVFPASEKTTTGLYRFQIIIDGDDRLATVICDVDVPPSANLDNPLVYELEVTRHGCTPADRLKNTALVTDFSEYAVGQFPFDWSTFWNPNNSDWIVTAGATIADQYLAGNQTSVGARVVVWDAVREFSDVEVLAKVLTHNTQPNIPSPVVVVRGSGSTATQASGYYVGLYNGNQMRLGRITNGSLEQLNELVYPYPYQADTWQWIRLRVEGNRISASVWSDGSVEPNGWLYSVTDPSNSITGPGVVGIASFDENADPWIDYFSVGVGGSSALPKMAQTCIDSPEPAYLCP